MRFAPRIAVCATRKNDLETLTRPEAVASRIARLY
jgi:hypothetical protein